jgi:hypothetical protein
MSDPDDFDALLKQRFDSEHQHVPAEPFVAAAMRRLSAERRYRAGVGTALRAAALVAAILASPWLIDGARRLNAALESSLSWTAGLAGEWVLGALAVGALLALRARGR